MTAENTEKFKIGMSIAMSAIENMSQAEAEALADDLERRLPDSYLLDIGKRFIEASIALLRGSAEGL